MYIYIYIYIYKYTQSLYEYCMLLHIIDQQKIGINPVVGVFKPPASSRQIPVIGWYPRTSVASARLDEETTRHS